MLSLSLIRSIYQTQRTMVVSFVGHIHTSSRHQTLHASHRTPAASSLFHIHPTTKKPRGAAVSHALGVISTQGLNPCRMNLPYGPFPGQRHCRLVGDIFGCARVLTSIDGEAINLSLHLKKKCQNLSGLASVVRFCSKLYTS